MADKKARLVRGRWLITAADAPVQEGAAVLVVDGKVAEVGPWRTLRQAHPRAEVSGSEAVAVMPGMVNAHHHSGGATHLQQGIPDRLLEAWLLEFARCRPSDTYLDTLLSAARLLRTGVTSVVDVSNLGGSAEQFDARARRRLEAYDKAGMRVALAAGYSEQSHLVSGYGEDEHLLATLPPEVRQAAERLLPAANRLDAVDYFAVMADLIGEYHHHPSIDIWYGPPGPQWASDDLLTRIAAAAEAQDSGIQTHVEESLYEKLHGPRDYGMPTVLHLRELGLLSPRFSIAHGVWLSEAEIAVMAETGAAVSHNPGSNLRLRAGVAPLNEMLAAGVTVALGMDGTTINDDEDMFAELRLALRLHRTPTLDGPAPTLAQVFAMATQGGAKLMRREERLGRLEPGYDADIVLVDLARVTWPWIAPEADPFTLVLLRAKAGDVDTVLVGGEVVLAQGRPTGFDATEAGAELAKKLSAEAFPEDAVAAAALLNPYIIKRYLEWELPELEPYAAFNSKR